MRATPGATGAKRHQRPPCVSGGYRCPGWAGLWLVGGGSRTKHGQLTRARPSRRGSRTPDCDIVPPWVTRARSSQKPSSSRLRSAPGSPNASYPASTRRPTWTRSRSGSRRPSADSTSSNPARSPVSPRSRFSRGPARRFGEKRRVSSRGGSRARLGRAVLRKPRRASRSGLHPRGPASFRTDPRVPGQRSPVRPSTQADPRPGIPLTACSTASSRRVFSSWRSPISIGGQVTGGRVSEVGPGLGSMGRASALHVARRGHSMPALDADEPCHTQAPTGPLVQRAHALLMRREAAARCSARPKSGSSTRTPGGIARIAPSGAARGVGQPDSESRVDFACR
jgi:hypothetical protein